MILSLAQREDLTNRWMLCSQKEGANGAFVVSKVGLAGGKPEIAISDEDEPVVILSVKRREDRQKPRMVSVVKR